MLNIHEFSTKYRVEKLKPADVDTIYDLSVENPLYYKFCPPFVTKESVLEDMKALPPGKTYEDKYYIGFFEDKKLVAVMDIISHYPNAETALIGLFMMCKSEQGKGVGSSIIREFTDYVKKQGYRFIQLGFAKGNPQSEAFWSKNGFTKTGVERDCGGYTVVVMEKEIG